MLESVVMDRPETPQKRSLAETFERVWSQALLAVSTAEEEATRSVQRVADLAGWSQEEMIRQARLLTERLTGHRKDLEHNVEEGVRRTLLSLKVPRREQIQDIEARLTRLAERIDALGQRK
jgi:Ni,Fe-hydrogenase III large subunit